jgi:hypothetical protein
MCQQHKVVHEVRQDDCKARCLLSRTDQRIGSNMIQEVEPKVLLLTYAVYIHIRGGFEAPLELCYESRTLIPLY